MQPHTTKGTVLAVDDEPLVLHLLANQGAKLGYAMTTASNGPAALAILSRNAFDILFTDILMPEMDGLTLLQKALSQQPDLQCIVASGQHEIKTAVAAMKQGAINYLPKPVSIQELEVALEKAMERLSLVRQLREKQAQLEVSARNLAEETAKNKMILEAAAEGIVGLDTDSLITFINPAALQMLGINRDEAMGKPLHTLTRHSQPSGRCYTDKTCPVCQANRQGAHYQSTGEIFHTRAGAPFAVALSCAPAHRDGKKSGAVVLFNDITEQKRIEDELHQHREHLEKLVTARTKQLAEANRQLQRDIKARIQAEREAERRRQQLIEADKMASLGVLVAGVAHEINNPNNFITMNTPILRQAWDDFAPLLERFFAENGDFTVAGIPYSEMRAHIPELFAGIMDGSERIKKIVLNLRDYARQGVAAMDQHFDLNQVVTAAMTLLANPLKKATNCLSIEYGDQLPLIRGNFQRAEQVVINLIQNAYQSLPDTGKGLSIATFFDKKRKAVIFQVRDEGAGIAKKNLKQIQDPFFTTKRDNGGTGLGLSISAGIMEEHGGRLHFTSESGKGTTAMAIFPVADHA